jgi:hypothetical protein
LLEEEEARQAASDVFRSQQGIRTPTSAPMTLHSNATGGAAAAKANLTVPSLYRIAGRLENVVKPP